MQVVAKSDKGLVRESNEDRFLTQNNLLAVADGMGGHLAGEVAAQIAIDSFASFEPEDGIRRSLENVFFNANRLIYQRGLKNSHEKGMGTTLTAIYLNNMKAHLAHIGDSRAYLVRGTQIKQLTEDHSYVNQLVSLGTLSKEEAENHPQRNVLLRVLGTQEKVQVDLDEFELKSGDRILISSDGLTNDLDQELVNHILLDGGSLEDIAIGLIDAALAAGGKDNVTVVLCQV